LLVYLESILFCYGKKAFFPRAHSAVLALAPILLFITNCLFAVEKAHSPKRVRYKILPLKHISVEQGEKCLAKVVTGTVTHFPGSSAFLLTARPSELVPFLKSQFKFSNFSYWYSDVM
jgi:hypothetical protein